jgi:hypothetical protein
MTISHFILLLCLFSPTKIQQNITKTFAKAFRSQAAAPSPPAGVNARRVYHPYLRRLSAAALI